MAEWHPHVFSLVEFVGVDKPGDGRRQLPEGFALRAGAVALARQAPFFFVDVAPIYAVVSGSVVSVRPVVQGCVVG